ncbi:12446_t:CDS:2 [Entrophospora sp. SA101]|nr:12446_t:CDS:2 [Entrophospora sp. SA101]
MFKSLKSSITSTLSPDTQNNGNDSKTNNNNGDDSSTLELNQEKREEIVKNFRKILGAGNEKYDNATLIRFAVAKSFNLEKAKQQLEEAMKWREKQKIDSIPLPVLNPGTPLLYPIRGLAPFINDTNVEIVKGVPDYLPRIYKYFGGNAIHKIDKDGRSVYIERLVYLKYTIIITLDRVKMTSLNQLKGYHDAKGLAKYIKSEELVDWHIRCQEFSHKVLMPELSRRIGRLIDKETVIFDCEGMGFHQLHMPALYLYRTIAEIDQSYYPERLGRLFVVNAPFMFVKIWALVKKWLDPGMLKKVHICGKDFKNILLEHIDEKNLPAFLGGKCTCSHLAGGCVPSVVLGNIPSLTKDQNSLQQTLPSTSAPPSLIPLESRRDGYNYRIQILKGDSKTYEVIITPSTEDKDQINVEIAFRKVEGKGKLKFQVKFIKFGDDDGDRSDESNGNTIMEPVTLKEEDTEKHIFDFKVKHNETGEFLLTWSFDEYSNSDNCIIEYFVKVDDNE